MAWLMDDPIVPAGGFGAAPAAAVATDAANAGNAEELRAAAERDEPAPEDASDEEYGDDFED